MSHSDRGLTLQVFYFVDPRTLYQNKWASNPSVMGQIGRDMGIDDPFSSINSLYARSMSRLTQVARRVDPGREPWSPWDCCLDVGGDGGDMFVYSTHSVSFLFARLHNVPPSLRHKSAVMATLLVIPGPYAPKNMHGYLEPLRVALAEWFHHGHIVEGVFHPRDVPSKVPAGVERVGTFQGGLVQLRWRSHGYLFHIHCDTPFRKKVNLNNECD